VISAFVLSRIKSRHKYAYWIETREICTTRLVLFYLQDAVCTVVFRFVFLASVSATRNKTRKREKQRVV
jgi:hypothetical protein